MRSLFVLILMAGAAMAADPAGFAIWNAGSLKSYEKKLAPKMNAGKVATEQLVNYGNHLTMVAHREGSGQAEWHETMADIFVVVSGEAILVVGGKIPDAKTTEPGEKRGASIEGGVKHKITAGDIVHIPSKTPHQALLDPGKQFTYFVIKVESK